MIIRECSRKEEITTLVKEGARIDEDELYKVKNNNKDIDHVDDITLKNEQDFIVETF